MCLQEAGRNRINMPSFFNCFLEQLGCETSNDVCLVGRSFQAWNPKLNILALDAIKWHHQKRLENIIHVPEYICSSNNIYKFDFGIHLAWFIWYVSYVSDVFRSNVWQLFALISFSTGILRRRNFFWTNKKFLFFFKLKKFHE